MSSHPPLPRWRVLLPVSLGTGLSLFGDSSIYTVLPTHMAEVGIAFASLGILLSANRFIRLLLNGPIGWASERWPRRRLFIPALLLGAISTAIYALSRGFWPLLGGRLLWGLAWVGIWVGGNTIVLDVAGDDDRGRWVGIYQVSFFLGAASGAIVGGMLTDWLGFHGAMGVGAILTLIGALLAWITLPETYDQTGVQSPYPPSTPTILPPSKTKVPSSLSELLSAVALLGLTRLTSAGFLTATLGLFLLDRMGDPVHFGDIQIGIATLTGIGLGGTTLIAMVTAPIMGGLSDRSGNRWRAVVAGVLPGVLGFGLLSLGAPIAIASGLGLAAVASGSSTGLSTTLIGELGAHGQHGRRLGVLFTVGDLASALGPPIAYAILPVYGVRGVYLLAMGLFGGMLLIALTWSVRRSRRSQPRPEVYTRP